MKANGDIWFLLMLSAFLSEAFLCPPPVCRFRRTRLPSSHGEEVPSQDIPESTGGGYFISPDQLNQLKESVDIISVVESYNLPQFSRRNDHTATAICPFHNDNSPSLSIDSNRKIYKCFSCGEGGDVFKFARCYSALQGQEMTFYESVRHIANEFGDSSLVLGTERTQSNSRETEEERRIREKRRARLLLCNAAAADFYANALVRLPAAGVARTHLLSRGVSPKTVRAFALGYAPDAYYSNKSSWGEGSLVNHLKSLGFSAVEIIDAGLATEVKRPNWNNVVVQKNDSVEVDPFQGLMDRFRGRLIVPIFDESGKNVIAFGGRILPGRNVTTDFKPPKYLNSPESPVFSKKEELFGLSLAKDGLEDMSKQSETDRRGTIIITEGYMDAIALWDAGVRNVVASMGTALTLGQLEKAAKAAGTMGGRIVLCLDNDEAGISAVERLCSSQILAKTCAKHVVEVLVATLPENVKDPGEYFESKLGDGDSFRNKVGNTAIEWSRWYTQRILTRYDADGIQGGPGSFADICERVSDFIATFPTPVDRTKRAYEVASVLSGIISNDSTTKGSSNALLIQLESDLVNMVARKSMAKEMVERRVEAVEGYGSQNKTLTMKRMLEGGESMSSIESSKLARNATSEKKARPTPSFTRRTKVASKGGPSQFSARGSRAQMKRQNPKREPLTPHFTGVPISKPSDADWFGVPRDKSFYQVRGLTFSDGRGNDDKQRRLVLFNSNDYHGDQYLTEQASMAGYTKGKIERNAAILEKGVGILISEDQDRKAKMAEERILRALVQYAPARSAMAAAVSSSDATGTRPEMEWSSAERSWLFDFLVFRGDEIPDQLKDREDLEGMWTFLASRQDAPDGAFGSSPFGSAIAASVVESHQSASRASNSDSSATRTGQLNAVDAKIVESSNGQEEPSVRVPSSRSDIDDWSASYDPSLFDDFHLASDESFPEDVQRIEPSDLDPAEVDVMSSGTVIDAKLESEPMDKAKANRLRSSNLEGALDKFFVRIDDIFSSTYDESVDRSYRAELDVQEALAYMLRASAAKKLANVNSNWLLVSKVLDARLGVKCGDANDVMSGVDELDSMNLGDLKIYYQSLLTRLQQLYNTVQQLDTSAKRISLRLMEFSQGDDTEGKISVAKQQKLAREVDEFVNNLPDDYVPNEDENPSLMDPMYILSLYAQPIGKDGDERTRNVPMQEQYDPAEEAAAYKRDMLIIEETWGDMDDPSYIWSMPDSGDFPRVMPRRTGNEMDEEDMYGEEEPLEEALARIDKEWGEWDDESVGKDNLREQPDLFAKFDMNEYLSGISDEDEHLNVSHHASDVPDDSAWE